MSTPAAPEVQAPASGGPTWVERHWAGLLTAMLCLSFVLRSIRLGEKTLWIDEIWSFGIARMPWRAFLWSVQNQDPNMGLYYVLLHFWMKLGTSEFILRAMSVPLGVAAVFAVYTLGARLFNRPVGLVAAALLTVNAFHVQWSQEARGYSLLVLLVTLSSYFFVRSVERPSTRNFVLYGLFSVLALYVHVYAALVLASHWASLIFLKRRDVPWKGLIASSGVAGVLTLPLGMLILQRAKHPWIPLGWLPKPSVQVVYDLVHALVGNADFPGSHGGKLLLAGYGLACLLACVALLQVLRSQGRSWEAWRSAIPLCWLVVPFAMAITVSLRQPMLMSRYLLICIPALVLLAAQGIRSIRPEWASAVAVVIVLGAAVIQLPQYYQHRAHYQEWKTVTDYIVAREQAGDGVIFCVAPGRLLFDYYREKEHSAAGNQLDVLYPEAGDEKTDPKTLDYLPPAAPLGSAAAGHPRVWLVLYHDSFSATEQARDDFEATLSTQYHDVQKAKFSGVTVLLYSNQGAPVFGNAAGTPR